MLGLSTQVNESNNLKAKVSQDGVFGIALKSLLSDNTSLIISTELEPTIVKGSSAAKYGFGLEVKL